MLLLYTDLSTIKGGHVNGWKMCNIQCIVYNNLLHCVHRIVYAAFRSVGLYANNKLTTKGLAVSLLHVL